MHTQSTRVTWDADIRPFGPAMRRQWLGSGAATAATVLVIVGVTFAATGELTALLQVAPILLSVVAGLLLLMSLTACILFRSGYPVRYVMTDSSLLVRSMARSAKAMNRASILFGLLKQSALLTGSSLIARSSENQEIKWRSVSSTASDDRTRSISLYNGWRLVALVQCTPDNHEDVVRFIDEHISDQLQVNRTSNRRKSTLLHGLARSAFVTVASIPLFVVAQEYTSDVSLPILTVCFGLAMVWLVGLLGWVVLGTIALQVALVVLGLVEERESYLWRGTHYRVYEILSDEDWAALLLAGLGAAALIWMSWGALRGKWTRVLLADEDILSEDGKT